jgi:hypothetical protein
LIAVRVGAARATRRGGTSLIRILDALALQHLVDRRRLLDGGIVDRFGSVFAVVGHVPLLPVGPVLHPNRRRGSS